MTASCTSVTMGTPTSVLTSSKDAQARLQGRGRGTELRDVRLALSNARLEDVREVQVFRCIKLDCMSHP